MAGRASKGKPRGMLYDKVRVWWPPTKDKKKTEFSGMYWPAKVVKHPGDKYEVQYDNGDRELVLGENVSPFNPPFKFGEETHGLQVGEFCEVFNDSKTDPAAWVAKVKKVGKRLVRVSFPFHDAEDDWVKPEHIRRARVYDKHTREWSLITPGQIWRDGEVSSPDELEQCDEETLAALLSTDAKSLAGKRSPPGRGGGSRQQPEAASSSKKEPAESAAPGRRSRRAASDDESGDSHRSTKKAKTSKQSNAAAAPAASGGSPIQGYITHHVPGLGPVLIPLSNVLTAGATALPPHLEAALQSLASSPQLLLGAPATALAPAAAPAPAPAAASLAALVPHLPQVAPPAALKAHKTDAHAVSLAPGAKQEPNSPSLGMAASPSKAGAAPNSPSWAGAVPNNPDRSQRGTGPSGEGQVAAGVSQAQGQDALLSGQDTDAQAAALSDGAGAEDGEGKKKKPGRKKKDPAAPKKALTSYLVFLNNHREEVIKENPEADLKEQVRLMAAQWKDVSADEKAACEAVAAADKQRYFLEKEKYEESLKQEQPTSPPPTGQEHVNGEDSGLGRVLLSALVDTRNVSLPKPKRPRTAYILYSMEFRKTLDPSINFNTGTKLAAEAWKAAAEEDKAPFIQASDKEKAEYDRATQVYQSWTAQQLAQAEATAAQLHAPAAAAAADFAQDRNPVGEGPSDAAGTAPALAASAPAAAAAAGPAPGSDPTTSILEELDLAKAKACLTRAGFQQEVYYMLVDVWRLGSHRLPDAIRSYKAHVATRKAKPDWKGFIVGIFGLDVIKQLLVQRTAPVESDAPVVADADLDEGSA